MHMSGIYWEITVERRSRYILRMSKTITDMHFAVDRTVNQLALKE